MEYTVSALSKDAESIRTEVFIEEQGFSNEFDETDCIAEHIVFYENGTPAAVCRFYPDHEEGVFVAGRIAVRRDRERAALLRRCPLFFLPFQPFRGYLSVRLFTSSRAFSLFFSAS